MVDVVVYGATGFTGRLICAELGRRGVSFAIAGRDGAKLRALGGQLGAGVPQIVAALDDTAALTRMAEQGRCVLACAGPFALYGLPVQDAALAAGRHFLDITGEGSYMQATHARDAAAQERRVALINAVGFDVVPTDAAAALASEAAGGAPSWLRIAFTQRAAQPTQGTTRSAVNAAREGGLAYLDGEWRRERVGADRWEAPFPEPFGRELAVSIPWGDVITAPRSTQARNVRTYLSLPPRVARLLPVVGVASRLLALAPARALAERWVRSLPEGPSEERRRQARFAVVAQAEGTRGTRRAWVTGGDGYEFTAASAALCAQLAAAQGFAGVGALTPTQAFGARALLEGLADAGVRYGMES
jgi:saccharopine dehydrogenase (NAD+, L-lysine-forming)